MGKWREMGKWRIRGEMESCLPPDNAVFPAQHSTTEVGSCLDDNGNGIVYDYGNGDGSGYGDGNGDNDGDGSCGGDVSYDCDGDVSGDCDGGEKSPQLKAKRTRR